MVTSFIFHSIFSLESQYFFFPYFKNKRQKQKQNGSYFSPPKAKIPAPTWVNLPLILKNSCYLILCYIMPTCQFRNGLSFLVLLLICQLCVAFSNQELKVSVFIIQKPSQTFLKATITYIILELWQSQQQILLLEASSLCK